MQIRQVDPTGLKARLDNGDDILILDVREPHEWDISNLNQYDTLLMPKGKVAGRMDELDPSKEMVVLCRTGVRSVAIIQQLAPLGFDNLWNLDGGINRWATEIDTTLPTY